MATVYDPNSQQNEQNQQPQEQAAPPANLQTIGNAAPTPPANTSQAPAARSQPQGSGRFTNIQKYLNANKTGGQQVASKIGQNITQGVTKEQAAAQKYNEQLGQSVQKANQVAQQGAEYQKQLGQIGQDISGAQTAGFDQRNNQQFTNLQNFTESPNFNQFQTIQAGQGIDENLLANQQQRLYNQANQAATSAGTAKEQLGNEAGRFELLRNAFGGSARPGYSQGQQRLDQVLLGQGGGLGQVQANVGTLAQQTQQQAKSAADQANEVSRIANQEQGLIGDINTQAGANEKSYIDLLNSYVDPLNQQRATEVQDLGKSLQSYNKTYDPATSGLTADQMAKLGLTDKNQGVYNVFKNQQYANATGATDAEKLKNSASFAANIGRDANGFQDVANQGDVNRYAALSKIIGKNAPGQLTKASELESAYSQKGVGEGGLNEQLTNAQKDFETNGKLSANDRYGDITGRADVMDLINKGKIKTTDMYFNQTGDVLSPTAGTINDHKNIMNEAQKSIDPKIYAALQKYLEEQNYAQTIGGQRETWLNADPKYSSANPKLDNAPVTGTDPSLNYKK